MLSVERKNTLGRVSTSVGQIIQMFPDIEMNLKVAKNSANIVRQILETSILCKKMSDKKNIAEMETTEGGPKSIVKEATHKLSHILSEMSIKIKIMTKIVEGDEVYFPQRAYKSLVLHILIWSTNISCS